MVREVDYKKSVPDLLNDRLQCHADLLLLCGSYHHKPKPDKEKTGIAIFCFCYSGYIDSSVFQGCAIVLINEIIEELKSFIKRQNFSGDPVYARSVKYKSGIHC
jgi:hypothetical protein